MMRRTQKNIALIIVAALILASAATTVAILVNRRDEAPPEATPGSSENEDVQDGAIAVTCEQPTVTVSSGAQLQEALDGAKPGDVITLEEGTYYGNFVASVDGTAELPIRLCGSEKSVLDGGGTRKGYVLHLDGIAFWQIAGFSVRNGQKGVMADGMTNSTVSGLTVSEIGDEGIHLRRFSTDNVVTGNHVSDTGQRKEKFGEGVYIGTAESNWCDISDCEPDRSDRNIVESNRIERTTSESVDIKEGTSGGVLRGNSFDGAQITAADSWVDVKGNDWLIEDNVGTDSPLDGFQTHEILDGWGTDNTFRGNTATVNGSGFGFSLTPVRDNVVSCTNTVSAAAEGMTNTACTD